ncbi:hypothetical protein [Bifidobacterium indicum]|uniref:hypothetical protein n=1 Tax=Bifidobacterium indicum TaxID=1691 RepID=UPI0030DDD6E2
MRHGAGVDGVAVVGEAAVLVLDAFDAELCVDQAEDPCGHGRAVRGGASPSRFGDGRPILPGGHLGPACR